MSIATYKWLCYENTMLQHNFATRIFSVLQSRVNVNPDSPCDNAKKHRIAAAFMLYGRAAFVFSGDRWLPAKWKLLSSLQLWVQSYMVVLYFAIGQASAILRHISSLFGNLTKFLRRDLCFGLDFYLKCALSRYQKMLWIGLICPNSPQQPSSRNKREPHSCSTLVGDCRWNNELLLLLRYICHYLHLRLAMWR